MSNTDWMKNYKKSDGIVIKIMTITPEMASEFLENEKFTRGTKKALVKKYTRHMLNKNWAKTYQSISFDKNVRMIDGHHRCEASVASGMCFEACVVVGLEESSAGYIDCGMSRSTDQRLSAIRGEKVNQRRTRNLTRMMQVDGFSNDKMSVPDTLYAGSISIEAIKKFDKLYGEGLDFAMANLKSHYHASIVAAVAKAYYNLDKYGVTVDKLERFCKIFTTGLYDTPYESTAAVCRNSFFDKFSHKKKADKKIDLYAIPVYAKMSYYIDAFLNGIVVKGQRRLQSDPFILSPSVSTIVKETNNLCSIVERSIRETVCASGKAN
ncbi:MAG: hypothetical protein WCS56_00260 [Bacilli bacterium]